VSHSIFGTIWIVGGKEVDIYQKESEPFITQISTFKMKDA
jgi:hypothetical protein